MKPKPKNALANGTTRKNRNGKEEESHFHTSDLWKIHASNRIPFPLPSMIATFMFGGNSKNLLRLNTIGDNA